MRTVLTNNQGHTARQGQIGSKFTSRGRNNKQSQAPFLNNLFQLSNSNATPLVISRKRAAELTQQPKVKRRFHYVNSKNKTVNQIVEQSIATALRHQKTTKKLITAKNLSRPGPSRRPQPRPTSIPRNLINILYRPQCSKPYLTALAQAAQLPSLDTATTFHLQRLCYIGIAREYVYSKKYSVLPEYSRVGLLIRPYMREVMERSLSVKMEQQPQTIYIGVSETALSFRADRRPKQLQGYLSKKNYSQIISRANRIISDAYQQYKKNNFEDIQHRLTVSEVIFYILICLTILLFLIWQPELDSTIEILLFCLILAVAIGCMGGAWRECQAMLAQVCPPSNATIGIDRKLREYFREVSGGGLAWRVGPDFYWIEVDSTVVKEVRI